MQILKYFAMILIIIANVNCDTQNNQIIINKKVISDIVNGLNNNDISGFYKYKESLGEYTLNCKENDDCYPVMLALEKIDPDYCTKIYLKILNNSSHPERLTASRNIGYIADKKMIKFIIKFISDQDQEVAKGIKLSLIKLNYEFPDNEINKMIITNDSQYKTMFLNLFDSPQYARYSKYIEEMLLYDTNILVKRSAAMAFGRMGEKKNINILVKAYYNEDDVIARQLILESIGKIGGKDNIKDIVIGFSDKDASIRLATINVLEEINTKEAIVAIEKYLESETDENSRKAALCVIERIKRKMNEK